MYARNRRRGMRGLGAALPPCSSVSVQPGFVGPVDCDPTNGGVGYPASQSQLADLWDYVTSNGPIDPGMSVDTSPSFSAWLNQNSKTVLIGAGVFVGVLFAMKAAR